MARRDPARHILVINDTPALLEMFAALLGDEGYRATTDRFAEPPATLLARIKDQRPDLLILDFLIGGEALGWQLLQMLKLDRETRELPVIICTAAVHQVKEIEDHLNQMGVVVVLKPFDLDVLLDVIRRTWSSDGVLEPGAGTDATTQPQPPRE